MTAPQPSWAAATPVTFVRVSPGHSRTRFVGNVSAGGVVSRTVIICTQLFVLPQPSVAFQVRVIDLVPPQRFVTASLKVTLTALQVSWAVAVPVDAGAVLAPHSSVRSGGQMMDGGV